MWTALALLTLLLVLGTAGVTGRGATDTRDPAFTARLSRAAARRDSSA